MSFQSETKVAPKISQKNCKVTENCTVSKQQLIDPEILWISKGVHLINGYPGACMESRVVDINGFQGISMGLCGSHEWALCVPAQSHNQNPHHSPLPLAHALGMVCQTEGWPYLANVPLHDAQKNNKDQNACTDKCSGGRTQAPPDPPHLCGDSRVRPPRTRIVQIGAD